MYNYIWMLTEFLIIATRLLSSGSLVIIAPTVEDTALYHCVVTNEAGEDSRSIELTVHGKRRSILVFILTFDY